MIKLHRELLIFACLILTNNILEIHAELKLHGVLITKIDGNYIRLIFFLIFPLISRKFNLKQLDQTFIVRYLGYDKLRHSNLNLCIELVMHYLPKKSNSKCDLEISVSHILIPLHNLTKNGE